MTTPWIANKIESLLREIEMISEMSPAGYSLMKGWLMAKTDEYRKAGYARDVAMALAIENYRN